MEHEFMDDGIEYIYAESEALDYGGSNEEPEFSDGDNSEYYLIPDHDSPFGL